MKTMIETDADNNQLKIFVDSHAGTLQSYTCYCCGKRVANVAAKFLIDCHTGEILADSSENRMAGRVWPIGSDCRRKHPGIDKFMFFNRRISVFGEKNDA
jgi:hypothetical protein